MKRELKYTYDSPKLRKWLLFFIGGNALIVLILYLLDPTLGYNGAIILGAGVLIAMVTLMTHYYGSGPHQEIIVNKESIIIRNKSSKKSDDIIVQWHIPIHKITHIRFDKSVTYGIGDLIIFLLDDGGKETAQIHNYSKVDLFLAESLDTLEIEYKRKLSTSSWAVEYTLKKDENVSASKVTENKNAPIFAEAENYECDSCGSTNTGGAIECWMCGATIKPQKPKINTVDNQRFKKPKEKKYEHSEDEIRNNISELKNIHLKHQDCEQCGASNDFYQTECYVCGKILPKMNPPLYEETINLNPPEIKRLAKKFFRQLDCQVIGDYPTLITFKQVDMSVGLQKGEPYYSMRLAGLGGISITILKALIAKTYDKQDKIHFYVDMAPSNGQTKVKSNVADFITWIKEQIKEQR